MWLEASLQGLSIVGVGLGHARQGEKVGKLNAWSSLPIRCGKRDPKLCWIDARNVEKEQKGSNLITDGTTQNDDNFIKEKEVECPISVFQLGLTEPNQSTGESLQQALDPKDQAVKVGPEVDVAYPLQNAGYAN